MSLATTIVTVDPRELVLLANNARYMTKDQFLRLVDNIRRDGRLTSTPLVAPMVDGRLEVLSGNHRVKAAIAAELDKIDVMRVDSPLTRDQRLAMQLSHNAIAGEDDPHKLRELFDSIGDVDLREYTGLDDEGLDLLLAELSVPSMATTGLDYKMLTILLFPEQLDAAREALDEARHAVSGDEVWCGRLAAAEALYDSLDVAARITGSQNRAIDIDVVLETFRRHVDDWGPAANEQPPPGDLMSVPALLGWDMPITAARTVLAAVDQLRSTGEITEPWQAVERWAAAQLTSG